MISNYYTPPLIIGDGLINCLLLLCIVAAAYLAIHFHCLDCVGFLP